MLLINLLMNTQFKSRQQTSFQTYSNQEQPNRAKFTNGKNEFSKNNCFGKQDNNVNANTNCSFVSNDYDEHFQPIYSENSNNHTINFDKYIKMKGHLQNAKKHIDGQIQFNECEKFSHAQGQVLSEQQYTIPLNKNNGKLHIDITEEITQKVSKKFKQSVKQQIKNLKAAQPLIQTAKKQSLKKNAISNISEDNQINIVKNIKIEAILSKAPLRVRYSALLQDHEKYEIGFEHKMLVKLLQVMDNTLDYLKSYRNNKSTFFSNLQANFKKNNGPELTYERMKKLLFLQQSLFELEWALKDSSNKYDLIIRLPQVLKFQERKKKLRIKIVHYLLAKQAQFLQSINQKKVQTNKWVDGFDPNNYKIPEKQLPIHPLESQISVKNLSEAQINAIPNNHLRNITADMKRQYEKKCLKSQDVISMIFSKTQKNRFEQKLYASIRQKQKMLKEVKAPVEQITKQLITNVLIEIQYIYNSKNVTNIFKSTLQQKLLKSLIKYANQSILQCLKIIIDAKDILFLKQQQTSNKTWILQINRAKYEDMKARIESMY